MIAFEVVFLAVFWLWVLTAVLFLRNTVLPRMPLAAYPEHLDLAYDTVQFKATDGVELEGWMIPGRPDRPWLILGHGLGTNRSDLLETAVWLNEEGFNLFLFDFRAHGLSAGRVTSFGWQEQRDLAGALTFLGQHPEVPARPYGYYGISMGGAVGLMVAAKDERIGAIAADSPYPSLHDSLGRHVGLLYRLPKFPFLGLIAATYRLRFGAWPAAMAPEDAIGNISPRPVLLIQGEADRRMTAEGARRMYERAGQPKDLWIIPGAGHLEGPGRQPDAYRKRVTEFFSASLSQP